MPERKYVLTLGELLDRLSILCLKDAKIPEAKKEIELEIKDVLDDINRTLTEQNNRSYITAEWIRDLIILSQFNAHIWYNESDVRAGMKAQAEGRELTSEELIDVGRRLILTHSLNGIRNTAKNRVNKVVGGRMEYKIDCLAADAEMWKPSGY